VSETFETSIWAIGGNPGRYLLGRCFIDRIGVCGQPDAVADQTFATSPVSRDRNSV
jgi:hypothetical protein